MIIYPVAYDPEKIRKLEQIVSQYGYIYYKKQNIAYKFIKLSKIIFHKMNLLPILNNLKIKNLS